jgi:hypothetical protein
VIGARVRPGPIPVRLPPDLRARMDRMREVVRRDAGDAESLHATIVRAITEWCERIARGEGPRQPPTT